MVGADETTKLWRPPSITIFYLGRQTTFSIGHFCDLKRNTATTLVGPILKSTFTAVMPRFKHSDWLKNINSKSDCLKPA